VEKQETTIAIATKKTEEQSLKFLGISWKKPPQPLRRRGFVEERKPKSKENNLANLAPESFRDCEKPETRNQKPLC